MNDINFNTPKELNNWMKTNIKYDHKNNWHFRSPQEVLSEKAGDCHDQSAFEYYYLKKMGYKCGRLFMVEYGEWGQPGGATHTLCYYIDNNNYCWIENAWGDEFGIHKSKSIEDLKHNVLKAWHFSGKNNKLFITNIGKVNYGMSLEEYVNACTPEKAPSKYYSKDTIKEFMLNMRNATLEEQKSISESIAKISQSAGIDFFDESENNDDDSSPQPIIEILSNTTHDHIFLSSDWHLFKNHYKKEKNKVNTKEIIDYCKKNIKPDDVFMYLGDISFRYANEEDKKAAQDIFKSLPGIKVLILGNHDTMAGEDFYNNCGFDYVMEELEYSNFIFTHRPIKMDLYNEDIINIHGHMHDEVTYRTTDGSRNINVYPSLYNNKPITLSCLVKHKEKLMKDHVWVNNAMLGESYINESNNSLHYVSIKNNLTNNIDEDLYCNNVKKAIKNCIESNKSIFNSIPVSERIKLYHYTTNERSEVGSYYPVLTASIYVYFLKGNTREFDWEWGEKFDIKESYIAEISSKFNINHNQKGNKSLSSFTKISLNNNISKYKSNKLLSHVRISDNTKGYLYIDKNNDLVAVINVEYKDNNENWIQGVEIVKEYQGYGLSKQLLNVATKELKANYLSVNKTNKLAKNIYNKYGFKVYDETEKMYFMKFKNNAINESKLSTEDRKKLKDSDFGIPETRYYPMPDKEHVRSAIRLFNKAPEQYKSELAKNIKKKMKEYNMNNIKAGDTNEFSKYLNEWSMASCNPIQGITKPFILKVSNNSNSIIDTKQFVFSPDIINDKYLVINENAKLKIVDSSFMENKMVEEYEFIGDHRNVAELYKAYKEQYDVDSSFIYTCLARKSLLDESQIDFDESFVKVDLGYSKNKIETNQASLLQEWNTINHNIFAESFPVLEAVVDGEMARYDRNDSEYISLREDVNGYFYYYSLNNNRTKSVPSLDDLTESMIRSLF